MDFAQLVFREGVQILLVERFLQLFQVDSHQVSVINQHWGVSFRFFSLSCMGFPCCRVGIDIGAVCWLRLSYLVWILYFPVFRQLVQNLVRVFGGDFLTGVWNWFFLGVPPFCGDSGEAVLLQSIVFLRRLFDERAVPK